MTYRNYEGGKSLWGHLEPSSKTFTDRIVQFPLMKANLDKALRSILQVFTRILLLCLLIFT